MVDRGTPLVVHEEMVENTAQLWSDASQVMDHTQPRHRDLRPGHAEWKQKDETEQRDTMGVDVAQLVVEVEEAPNALAPARFRPVSGQHKLVELQVWGAARPVQQPWSSQEGHARPGHMGCCSSRLQSPRVPPRALAEAHRGQGAFARGRARRSLSQQRAALRDGHGRRADEPVGSRGDAVEAGTECAAVAGKCQGPAGALAAIT